MSNTQGLVAFNATFDKARTIEFDPRWVGEGGSLRPAVYDQFAPKLEEGEVRSCTTPDKRKILLVGTFLGNVLVYQHHPPQDEPFFMAMISVEIKQLFGGLLRTVGMRNEDMLLLLGNETKLNIGKHLEMMRNMFTDFLMIQKLLEANPPSTRWK